MKIYHYHPTTYIFLGEGVADECQLEVGVYLIPAYATTTQPKQGQFGEQIIWNGVDWVYVPPEVIPESNSIIVLSPVDVLVEQKRADIRAEKYKIRDSGVLVNGILFDTDLEARISYVELGQRFIDDPTITLDWKASGNTWVLMDLALYQEVVTAKDKHIKGVFEWQLAVETEINESLVVDDLEHLERISTIF